MFQRSIADLTIDDLLTLLAERAVENIRLEFKSEMPKRDEMLKKISSFANTFGGYLVIGGTADSSDGRLTALPGIEPMPSLKQTVVQWCSDGLYPPLQPLVSDPIPLKDDPSRCCYVVFVEESEETPHFLTKRRGAWVRTDEYSKPFEPSLATYNDLMHLMNRRKLARGRRQRLLARARNRFNTYARTSYTATADRTPPIGSTLSVAVVPRYPTHRLVDEPTLLRLARTVRIWWRQVEFPTRGELLTQHESVVTLDPSAHFSLVEINLWGLAFYACELEEAVDDKRGIHLGALAGHVLVFLQHAQTLFRELHYDGALVIVLRMDRTLGRRVFWYRHNAPIFQSPCVLDDECEFEVPTRSEDLQGGIDTLARMCLANVLFALNWPEAITNTRGLDEVIRLGYEYNFWKR